MRWTGPLEEIPGLHVCPDESYVPNNHSYNSIGLFDLRAAAPGGELTLVVTYRYARSLGEGNEERGESARRKDDPTVADSLDGDWYTRKLEASFMAGEEVNIKAYLYAFMCVVSLRNSVVYRSIHRSIHLCELILFL